VGTVTAAGVKNLEDSSQTWREGQLIGFTVTLLDQKRVITDNTSTKISINRDWDFLPLVGDKFSVELVQFSMRKPVSPEDRAFGRDVLLVFSNFSSVGMVGDIRLNARGDLASVEGYENFEQALTIVMNTPKGSNRFHLGYGVGLVVGQQQRIDDSSVLLYTFSVRQSLLRDPRVDKVLNPRYSFEGGVSTFEAEVQPVAIRTAKYFRRSV
jgi:phage baseplate assembly protein W